MSPLGNHYDPDYDFGEKKRPAWATPRTPLAQDVLKACGRDYWHGTSRHRSEYEIWNQIEDKATGASDECFLYRAWIQHWIDWAKSMNVGGTRIVIGTVMKKILDDDARVDWTAKNRERLLSERKTSIPDFDKRLELNKLSFDKKLAEMEESDE